MPIARLDVAKKQPASPEQTAAESPLLSWSQLQEKFKFLVSDAHRQFAANVAAGVIIDHAEVSRIAVRSEIEDTILGLKAARKNSAAELSREYNISEKALIDLESLPSTIKECLQIGKDYTGPAKLRLVLGEPVNFKAIETGQEIIIANIKGNFNIFYQAMANDKCASFICSQRLKTFFSSLSPSVFNGKPIAKSERSRALYEQVYKEVSSKGGWDMKYGQSMEEIFTRHLKVMILLGLDPKELIEKQHLCVDTPSGYANKEALIYIKALETEEFRKRSRPACQSALVSLEDSSTDITPMLFSGRAKGDLTNTVKAFSDIVCDYLHGSSTLEAEHALLRRRV